MPQYYLQRHQSSVKHFDLRLETEEGYRSWALPKGMPQSPGEARLAVETPLHDKSYLKEGIISEGYGTGVVQFYDVGNFEFKDPPTKKKLNIFVDSARIEGGYFTLLNTKDNQWLILKHAGAVNSEIPVNTSVLTGRTMEEIALGLPFKPELCKLVEEIPVGEDYYYSTKLDGYRLIAAINYSERVQTTNYPALIYEQPPQKVSLYSRKGQDWTNRFPSIRSALEELNFQNVTLDGEVVIFNEDGIADFAKLHAGEGHPVFVIFDAPSVQGTLEQRQQWIKENITPNEHIQILAHYDKPWDPCALGQEGLVIKRRDSLYEPDNRGWMKYKCGKEQEFIILGFTTPKGSRQHIGALLLGYYENGELRYAGKVGTGFTDQVLESLDKQLQSVPLGYPLAKVPGATWLEPKLVANVKFMDFNASGMLRHPSFVSLRDDKIVTEVVRETPEVTHPSKMLWPNVSKQDLVDYFDRIGDRMLEELRDRPIIMYRCPEGIDGACFFQRHATHSVPGLEIVDVDGNKHYVVASKQGLRSLAQLSVVEIHLLPFTVRNTEEPDRIIFDIDPGDNIDDRDIIQCAKRIKNELSDDLQVASHIKSSGQRGLHIIIPVSSGYSFEEAKAVADSVRNTLVEKYPEEYSTRPNKNKIYIDTERNSKFSSTVAMWSPRATSEATVSIPLSWDSLSTTIPKFSIGSITDDFLKKTINGVVDIMTHIV